MQDLQLKGSCTANVLMDIISSFVGCILPLTNIFDFSKALINNINYYILCLEICISPIFRRKQQFKCLLQFLSTETKKGLNIRASVLDFSYLFEIHKGIKLK